MAKRGHGAGAVRGTPAPLRGHGPLRSDAWFTGDDEVAMQHRVAFATAGLEVSRRGGRPVIGIANSASELNPCNLPLRELAGAVRRGVLEAGGIPAEFGSISLGEDLMKPTSMLYRNLLAIEIEEMIRANPLDGIVILANCDKTVPGAIMGAASADIPTVVVTGGARPAAVFQGERIGTATALWRLWDERRTGRLDDDGLMVPLQSIIIPEYVNLGKLGLINTYLGAILVYVALGIPFATFLMATYYRGISDDLIEAAVMDGLGYVRTFLRIAVPLSWPAIATVTVLQFIQIWDDLLVGLLFLQNPQQRTITVGLAALSAGRTTSIPVLMAGSFVSAVPAIIVYLIFQRYLVRGLTLGMGK